MIAILQQSRPQSTSNKLIGQILAEKYNRGLGSLHVFVCSASSMRGIERGVEIEGAGNRLHSLSSGVVGDGF